MVYRFSPRKGEGTTPYRPRRSVHSREKRRESREHETIADNQPKEEDEDGKNKRESEVRVTAEFFQEFNKKNHAGRVPPDPSVLPAKFLCVHCHRMVEQKDNKNPWIC
ncbi:hypothetical protein E0Z10_g1304 [Xylaria hypoxylon]|uniref:Uncharacterized protein n=1 Tax=Xylaria hypoxylon TaxID=37992 RepID=A0A4Z0Z714_9PEZI|nr:hypothetical protein E0Z10_g1304 [Xylaria hypoxylon]